MKTLIAVTVLPVKIQYVVGEGLDLSGLVVTAIYSDGSTKQITDYTTDPVNNAILDIVGEHTVTIRYTEKGETKTADFTVTVNLHEHIWW